MRRDGEAMVAVVLTQLKGDERAVMAMPQLRRSKTGFSKSTLHPWTR